jgi:hypothetical protein
MDDVSRDVANGTGGKYIPLNPNAVPDANELKSMFSPFINKVGGYRQDDIIEDRIFDTRDVTGGATNNLQFFQSAGSLPTSNMEAAGQLPSQEAFYITGIKFTVYTSANTALDFGDAYNILKGGSFNLTISNKPYISGDLLEFLNPLSPLVLNTRYFTTVATKSWNLRIRQVLPPQTSFKCAVTTTTSAYGTAGTYSLRCYLIGYRYRSIQ